jgi:hypothetical protein
MDSMDYMDSMIHFFKLRGERAIHDAIHSGFMTSQSGCFANWCGRFPLSIPYGSTSSSPHGPRRRRRHPNLGTPLWLNGHRHRQLLCLPHFERTAKPLGHASELHIELTTALHKKKLISIF